MYHLISKDGKTTKVAKIVNGDMPEKIFLEKLYQGSTSKTKIEGVELCPKEWLKLNFYTIKVTAKYCGDLNQLITDNQYNLSPKLAETIIRQLTKGFATLYKHQIAHGDIKCSNIFYRRKNGELRFDFADFGHASDLSCYAKERDRKVQVIDEYFAFTKIIFEILEKAGIDNFETPFLSFLNGSPVDGITLKKRLATLPILRIEQPDFRRT